MLGNNTLNIDGKDIAIENESNLLEMIRKAGIEIPTFCYHSELSVYGACRLCMIEVQGRGLVSSCSTPPEKGMVVKTNTDEIRDIRKTIIELLLSSGEHNCPTCNKGTSCQLLSISRRLGIDKINYKPIQKHMPIDDLSHSIVRDPNKCILCGDCVRMCSEVQSIGAIDFAYRGSQSAVLPSFGKTLDKVECVYCGQCASVCPTGALVYKSEINEVWKAINDPKTVVIAQVAPAVRVALGECFSLEPGQTNTGQIVAALRKIGFDYVYDTSFTADLTILEEATELVGRLETRSNLPLFTSCCPGWVKFVEQYYPEFLQNLSSCKSPQQMFGAISKELLPEMLNIDKQNLVVVSIMPCTAKKFEAKRPEFSKDGISEVDHVITTIELSKMIDELGINFKKLRPESFDLPFGFKTGAGVIFGNSGGVSEAVIRYMSGISPELESKETSLRGSEGLRETEITFKGRKLKFAVIHSLKNARKTLDKIKNGEVNYDFIEVMACPGGCIGGGGQPCHKDRDGDEKRTELLFDNDKMQQLHRSQDNPYVNELYSKYFEKAGSHKAHHLLHTHYHSKKRINSNDIEVIGSSESSAIAVTVCLGTGCYVRGSQGILHKLVKFVEAHKLEKQVKVNASFCFESCDNGPMLIINNHSYKKCSYEQAISVIEKLLKCNEVPCHECKQI